MITDFIYMNLTLSINAYLNRKVRVNLGVLLHFFFHIFVDIGWSRRHGATIKNALRVELPYPGNK